MAAATDVQVSHFLNEYGVGPFHIKLIIWPTVIALTPIFFRQHTGVIKANQAVDNMIGYGPRVWCQRLLHDCEAPRRRS
jgi:hypothetical protein